MISALAGMCLTLLTRQGVLIWRTPGKRSQLALGMGLETPASLHHRMQLPTQPTAPVHGPVRCAISRMGCAILCRPMKVRLRCLLKSAAE